MESRWLHYTNKYNRIQNSGTFCNDPCIIRQPAKHSIPLQILLIRERNMTCLSVWKTPHTDWMCYFQSVNLNESFSSPRSAQGFVFRRTHTQKKKKRADVFNIWCPITGLLPHFIVTTFLFYLSLWGSDSSNKNGFISVCVVLDRIDPHREMRSLSLRRLC